ncbi:hypothetical protein [Microbacterium sp. PA5]|uniref:hypothetical protein n=1 Tax=Microbacterium sp. PA5 TaxID=3416654 RepID=UPI003CFA8D79
MRVSMRSALSSLGVVFTAYLAVGGMIWTVTPDHPLLMVGAIGLYLVTVWLCIFWNPVTAPLPVWLVVLSLVTAVIVPNVTWFAAGTDARLQAYATWGLGGISALMAILVVRRRVWAAWFGVAIIVVTGSFWIGIVNALSLGAVGAVVWVGIAQLVTGLMARAARDTAELTELQRSSSEWLASQSGRRRERRVTVQRAIALAGPVLTRVIETGGVLDDEERAQARLTEGRLRDELRGRRLLDDDVRVQLEAVRRRGTEVTMLDEGGLDGVDEDQLTVIRGELAKALSDARSERVFIRTSQHESIAVTVVGRSRSEDDPDGEDVVDLWHEIRWPAVREPEAVEGAAEAQDRVGVED